MSCDYNPYTLPTIDFVGGETQDIVFRVYHYVNNMAFSLNSCTANFSVVGFGDKNGTPYISKEMTVLTNDDGTLDNILRVTLTSSETVDLSGKFIYQITIKDIGGDVEIPKQGILFIINNINKSFIKQ